MLSWYERARAVLPAGSFGNMDGTTLIERGQGAYVWDVQGRQYLDYLIGSGPMILGHNDPEVTEAVIERLGKGSTFFATSTVGIELAEMICSAMPCAEKLRYVSTGGEADMYALRLARAFTGRDKILKFEGGYHGMSAEAQMSLMPRKCLNFPVAEPDSAGILQSVREHVLVAPFNDSDFVRSVLAEQGEQIAAIIVEPFQRIIPPLPGFLELLRSECDKYGILLIFDEVVCGFRFAWGGGQVFYGVQPDICTLGKIIGGGFALAAIAGRADIMTLFDKSQAGEKWLMQIGTLSGNPVAAMAGLKTLEILSRPGQYDRLRQTGRRLQQAMTEALTAKGITHHIVGDDTLFDVIFSDNYPRNYRDILNSDMAMTERFNAGLQAQNILKPSQKIYVHLALSESDIDHTCSAFKTAADTL